MDRSLGDLELECVHRFIIFGYDDEARRILIESVYDARPFYSVDDGWCELWILMTDTQILEMIQESVH